MSTHRLSDGCIPRLTQATDVTGRASAGYLLGFSGGFSFSQMQTLALDRVEGDGALYSAALQNPWEIAPSTVWSKGETSPS